MFSYQIITKPNFKIDTNIIDNIFKVISTIIKAPQNGILNIVFLDDDSIKNLNNNYRNINNTTDVLSFHYFESFKNLNENEIAGEIIMSENKINTQGKEFGLGSEKEFYKLLIHSILHILGHDHENDDDYLIMDNLESQVWAKVFNQKK